MTELLIENARPDDVKAVVLIAEACGLSCWPLEDYSREIERADSIFLCVRPDTDTVTGFIMGRVVPSADPKYSADAEILNIAMRPEMQNKGMAGLLMEEFFLRCRKMQVHKVWLEVRKSNARALRFYVKRGFIASGIRRNFYKLPVEDAVIMTCVLQPHL